MKRPDSLFRSRLFTKPSHHLVAALCFSVVSPGCGPGAAPASTESSGDTSATATATTTAAASTATATTVCEPDGCGGCWDGIAGTKERCSTAGEVPDGPTGTGTEPTSGSTTCTSIDCAEACDVFAQDCPEGEKCAPVITDGGGSWNESRCVPVTGSDAPGDPCTAESVADGLDSCEKAAICWYVDMDGNGSCVALCTATPDEPTCPNNGLCTISADGVLNLCIPECDPLLQDCAEGAACYPINDGFSCAPDASGDTGKANDPCEFINVCEAGLLCADAAQVGAGCPPGSMSCCTPFCAFPGGPCPNPDQQCVQWFDPMMFPGGDPQLAIGYCGVPQ